MGIFGRKTDRDVRENQIIKDLTSSISYDAKNLGQRLSDIKSNPEQSLMKPYYLYFDVIEMIMSNSQFKEKDYIRLIEYAEKIYKNIFVYEDETPDMETLEMIFIEMFDVDGVAYRNCFNTPFFNLFRDKHNYIKWVKSIFSNYTINAITDYYVSYALTARSYFIDEDMFTANVINVTNKLILAMNQQEVFDNEIKNLEHMVGIYNVDEARILSAEQHIESAEAIMKQSSQVLNLLDERIKTVEQLSRTTVANVNQMCDSQVSVARAELAEIREKMNREYNDFLENQKRLALFDRQQFLDGVFEEAQQKLDDMKQLAQRTVSTANMELTRINQESGAAVSKLDAYVKNEEKMQQIITVAASLPAGNVMEQSMAASTVITGSPVATISTGSKTVYSVTEEEAIPSVNPLLDDNISFADRYERVMGKKAELEAKGEHFHEMFDDVVTAVMENSNPYLIGPSGCGKTYMVSQIARVLNMDFIDIGYINEEYDILGFQTADGGYSRPNFYRCYKYGKIAFCDELDNGNSRATVKLNSFLSNTDDASYNFPHGENVKRHGNFRMIGAGNTAGNGADNNYNTREKIEESVQQRFTPIYVGYDNEVEKAILGDYDNWYEFVVLFRQATDAWGANNYGDAPGIITTRDVTRIKKYLDHKSFDINKIVAYEFVQTKSVDYLAFLDEHMKKSIARDSKAMGILNTFSMQVQDIRQKALAK